MSTSIPNIDLNECALFDKTNYIEPAGNDQLLAIYNQLSAHGSELVAGFNACAEKLSQLMEKYPGHTGSDGKSNGKLVGPIATANLLRTVITKNCLRAGWFARSGSGKSTILNRLYSDTINSPDDFANQENCFVPITKGGKATSSCAFILAKKNDEFNQEIRIDFLEKSNLQKKLIAALNSVGSIGGFPIQSKNLKTFEECKLLYNEWLTNGNKEIFKAKDEPQYHYVWTFIEQMIKGQIGNSAPKKLESIKETVPYAAHGNIACANVQQIYARIIDKDYVPKILEMVDIPGSNAQELDKVYFDFVEKSLDMMIFMFKEGGGNINDVDQEKARDKYIESYWDVNGIKSSKRYIFVYNKGRQIEKNRPDLCTNGSLTWAKTFLHDDLSRLFMFDGFDFINDENRYPFNDYKEGEISGIEKYWERIKPLNNNGGLHFLRNYLFVEWPLIVIDEIKTSIKNQIKSLHDIIEKTAKELDLLSSLKTPFIQQQLSKALTELSTLKTKISCDFGALKSAVRELKNKIDTRMDNQTRRIYIDPLQTKNQDFIRLVALCCQFFVENDIYPFLLNGLIQKPIEELSNGIKTECRWSADSQVSKPLAELIRSKRPVNIAGETRFYEELRTHQNDPTQLNLTYFENAIESAFFRNLEDKTALNELRDDAVTMLTPLVNASDLETPERRGDLFDLAKGACVNLATDLGSVVQAYWFVKVNDILTDLRDLTANVQKA
jgi:hypothetical protein